ncbi:hypothetical protein ACFL2U_02830 [Patescibacteria group bacterium]
MEENKQFFLLLLAMFLVALPSIAMAFKTPQTQLSKALNNWRMPILAAIIFMLIFFVKC